MINPWNELHSLILYIIFGYTLLLPLVLVILKFFGITSPLQRLRLYLLAFLTPPASFLLYHSVLTKRCESGLSPIWSDGSFHFLCIISENILRLILPLAGLMLLLGTLKIAAATLLIRRFEKENHFISDSTFNMVNSTLLELCSTLRISRPRIIFSSRDGFAAFTTGFRKPVLIINSKIAGTLNEQDLKALISHELIHILNSDTVKSWLLHLLRDLTFINPMSNMLLKGYLLEKEALCDQKAARLANQAPRDYAASLIKIWRSVLTRRSPSFGLVSAFVGNSSGLERRVGALLKHRQDDSKIPSLLTILLGSVLFITTLLFLGTVC